MRDVIPNTYVWNIQSKKRNIYVEEVTEMSYKVDIICYNCGCEETIEIEFGVRLSEKICPNCGCDTLRRKAKFYFG